jgi:hypothetical protein
VGEAAASANSAAEAERRQQQQATSKLSRRLTLTAIATAIGVTGSALGLAFDLHPAWRPDPGSQLDATMTAGPIETHVGLGDYLKRIGRKATAAQRPVLGVWGDVVYVRLQTEGLKHQSSTLRWYLYKKATGQRIKNAAFIAGHGSGRSSTPSDTIVVPAWVQPPTDRGKYFLRFELSAKGVLLAIADSPPFDYCHSTGCGAATP